MGATMHAGGLADDPTVVQRVLDHIDHRTTDLAEGVWREPLDHYRSAERFEAELDRVLRRLPVAFCPSAALVGAGSYVAREAAGTPVVAVRGRDGTVRAFLNACSHRGAQVACGAGEAKALACPYHGWTFGLDGGLRGIPHAHGFPDLDRAGAGLVPFDTVERGGVVFVAQRGSSPNARGAPDALDGLDELDELPTLIGRQYRLDRASELDVAANWKIAVEGFLEGYHIRATHTDTFFPVQYDNVNVVEAFGRHNRVAFPYRNIEALRDVDPGERSAAGRVTYVHHLFPNAIVATFPGRITLAVMEPTAIDSTRFVTYELSERRGGDGTSSARAGAAGTDDMHDPDDMHDRDHTDVAATERAEVARAAGEALVARGAAEDRAVITSIQRSLAANPRECFEFGLFEGAIGHFHRELTAVLSADAEGR